MQQRTVHMTIFRLRIQGSKSQDGIRYLRFPRGDSLIARQACGRLWESG